MQDKFEFEFVIQIFFIASLIESEVLFVFSVVQIGGKQYKVQEGDVIFVEKLKGDEGETLTFNDVLAISDQSKEDGFTVGTPMVSGASVSASIVKHGKEKKIYVFKYKSKKNEKKKIGHRQPYTKIQIQTISS